MARHVRRAGTILIILYLFALRAFRAPPARRAVSESRNGVFHDFGDFYLNAGFVGQIDYVVF